VDGLRVMALLARLDIRKASDVVKLSDFVRISADEPVPSYEKLVDAVRKYLAGPDVAPLPIGGSGDLSARATLYDTIDALQNNEIFKSLEGKLNIEVSSPDLAKKARTDFGALIALHGLSPIYVSGVDTASQAALEAVWQVAWGEIYAAWQFDRNSAHPETFSDDWMADRSAMLNWVIRANREDNRDVVIGGNGAANQIFRNYDRPGHVDSSIRTGELLVSDIDRQHFLFGSSGADSLAGGNKDDHVYGGAGDDLLIGGDGADLLEGNTGKDVLDGGSGQDTLAGGQGDDRLLGGAGNDLLLGGSGADELSGDSGNDVLNGGAGADTLWGGADNDYLFDEGGSDTNVLHGDDGNDVLEIRGGAGESTLDGGAGNDILIGGQGKSTLDGGKGNDSIRGGDGADTINAGEDADFVDAGAGNDQVTGGKGADYLKGGAGSDTYLYEGNDFGVDLIEDGQGGDVIRFGETSIGSATYDANKRAWVGNGVEIRKYDLNGSTTLVLSQGGDKLNTIYLRNWQPGQYGITLSGEPQDRERPQVTLNAPTSRADNNFVDLDEGDAIDGGQGNDVLRGTDSASVLAGGTGNDVLDGRGGDDWLEGGAGNDIIFTGEGKDVAYGGAGNDLLQAGANFDITRTTTPDTLAWIEGSGFFDWLKTDADTAHQFWYSQDGQRFDIPHPELAGFDIDFKTELDSNPTYQGYLWWFNSGSPEASLEPSMKLKVTLGDSGDVQRGSNLTQEPPATLGKPKSYDLVLMTSGDKLKPGSDLEGARLYGGIGNDVLFGGNENDKLYGEADNDVLVGNDGDDLLDGGEGADELSGGAGRDFLDGGDDKDTLVGGIGADVLHGGKGDDRLYGDAMYLYPTKDYPPGMDKSRMGGDFLDGGEGNDSLWGNHGDDYLFGGTGQDELYGGEGDDHGFGESGADALWGGNGNDYLDGGADNDSLMGDEGNDFLSGGANADLLWGDAGDDVLDGGTGGDILTGGDGSDYLRGGDDNDTLYGDAGEGTDGADILEGGAGNDEMSGGGGNDLYLFSRGDGQDIVRDDGAGGSRNVIAFKFSSGDVRTLERDGADLLIKYGATDQVRVVGYYLGSSFGLASLGSDASAEGQGDPQNAIAEIRFEDGTVWGRDEILAKAPPPPAGEPPLDPFAALAPLYFVNALLARDEVKAAGKHVLSYSFSTIAPLEVTGVALFNDAQKQAVRDALARFSAVVDLKFVELADDAQADLSFHLDDLTSEGAGAAAGYAIPANGEIHLNSTLYSLTRKDEFGDSALRASLSVGSAGFEVLLHEIGHALGLKHPFEPPVLPNEENNNTNTVMSYTRPGTAATALAPFDVAALQRLYGVSTAISTGNDIHRFGTRWVQDSAGKDLFDASAETQAVFVDLTPGSWIYKGSKATSILADNQAFIGFGTQIEDATGGSGDDTLTGNDAANVLTGGGGNDVLRGGGGADILAGGDGSDTYVWGAGSGKDIVTDAGLASADIDTLRVTGGLEPDDTVLTRAGDDLMIRRRGGDDSVTVSSHFAGTSIERIVFDNGTSWDAAAILANLVTGTTEGADIYLGTEGDDRIDGLGGNDEIGGLGGADAIHGGSGNDTLRGDDGNDSLYGDEGIDVLIGGNGDDLLADGETMDGGFGSDTYVWGRGAGLSVIGESDRATGDVNTLRLKSGISPADVVLSRNDFDLQLWVKGTADGLTITRQFTDGVIGSIVFDDGTVWDASTFMPQTDKAQTGTAGNDVQVLGPFNDSYEAGAGDDRIEGRDGNDTLRGEDGNDSLNGGNGGDLLYGGAGQDLLAGDDGDDQLVGDAGDDTLQGGTGNDFLQGGAGSNVLYGGDGNDELLSDTPSARDTMYGAQGDDTYRMSYGQRAFINAVSIDDSTTSNDRYIASNPEGWVSSSVTQTWTINDAGGDDDQLSFTGFAINPSSTVIRSTGTGFSITGTNLQILIQNAFDANGNKAAGAIEKLTLGNGAVYDFSQLIAATQQSTTGDDSILGFAGNDTLDGGNGQDSLDGGAGDDVLKGGGGFDRLWGGAGNDTLEAGPGGGSLNGGAGDDTFIVRAGDGAVDISSDGSDSGVDTLLIDDLPGALSVTLDAVSSDSDEDQVTLRWNDGSASVRFGLKSSTSAISGVIERVRFRDGSELDIPALIAAKLSNPTAVADLLRGTGASDQLQGLEGNDTLYGRDSADTLDGGLGDDQLFGGLGDDLLIGGAGNDTFNGGAGRNTFVVSDASGSDIARYDQGASNLLRVDSDVAAASLKARWSSGSMAYYRNSYEAERGSPALRWQTNLILSYGGSGSTLTVDAANFSWTPDEAVYAKGRFGVEGVAFAGGGSRSLESLVAEANTVTAGNDVLLDALETNVFSGGAGNDTVYGFNGANRLEGEDGNDFVVGGDDDDALISGGAGNDTLVGGLGSDLLLGGDGDDRLAAGTDWLQAGLPSNSRIPDGAHGTDRDTLIGGAGNDILSAGDRDVVFQFGRGFGQDAVFGAQTRGYSSTIRFDASINPADVQFSRATDRQLLVSIRNSADVMSVASFFNTEDVSNELSSFYSSARFEFADGSVVLASEVPSRLVAVHTPMPDAFVGTDGDDVLSGEKPLDALFGGAGNDTLSGPGLLVGGEGADTYRFDFTKAPAGAQRSSGQDVIIDEIGEDADTLVVAAGIAPDDLVVSADRVEGYNRWVEGYTLRSRVTDAVLTMFDVENVRFSNGVVWGIDELEARTAERYGKSGNDTLTGDQRDNRMSGLAGNDSLVGNEGNDTLDGGLGVDTMKGGVGDDLYVVDNAGDVVSESANQGVDMVTASVSYTLTSNVEQLSLSGTADINGTGNTLANVLTGNDGANVLDGLAGADTMQGGGGNDVYKVDNVLDVVIEKPSSGTDRVESTVTYTLSADVEQLTLLGTGNLNGSGNASANTLLGNAGINRLDGGAGADSMTGGAGNDTYVVDNAGDLTVEAANGGTDTVESSVTWSLMSETENLTLTGDASVNGTGTAQNNTLRGNTGNNLLSGLAGNDSIVGGAGDDTLDGGAGVDTLVGGTGNDTYVIDATTDVITENANEGTDTIVSAVTLTLATNLENVTLSGTTGLGATGNAANNVMTGNAGANALSGAAGNDTLDGAGGNDTLTGGAGADGYVFGRGYGSDTIIENDATTGVKDFVSFGATIAKGDISFQKSGNALLAKVNGTSDVLTLQDWYLGSKYHVEEFRFGDGTVLTDTQAQALVSAMAAFSSSGTTSSIASASDSSQRMPSMAVSEPHRHVSF